jgi:hypothetical protein
MAASGPTPMPNKVLCVLAVLVASTQRTAANVVFGKKYFAGLSVPDKQLLDHTSPEFNNNHNNKLSVHVCGLQGNPRRCAVDTSAFNPMFLEGDIIDVDFGPNHHYSCRFTGGRGSSTCVSKGPVGGKNNSSSISSSISSSSSSSNNNNSKNNNNNKNIVIINNNNNNNNNNIMGDMNVVTRGTNARGESNIFGSTSVGGEICDFSPDASGTLVVECKSESEYPPESEPTEDYKL